MWRYNSQSHKRVLVHIREIKMPPNPPRILYDNYKAAKLQDTVSQKPKKPRFVKVGTVNKGCQLKFCLNMN